MVSLIINHRAIPIYFELLDHVGNSDLETQESILSRILPILTGFSQNFSLYFQGVKVTKTKGFAGANVVCKWKRKYRGWTADEAWFILTNLNSLYEVINAYQKRFGIEEMFRDFKSVGYNLEGTKVTGHRLMSLILLITLAYSQATLSGEIIKNQGVAKYVGRVTEKERNHPRHSNFYVG